MRFTRMESRVGGAKVAKQGLFSTFEAEEAGRNSGVPTDERIDAGRAECDVFADFYNMNGRIFE